MDKPLIAKGDRLDVRGGRDLDAEAGLRLAAEASGGGASWEDFE